MPFVHGKGSGKVKSVQKQLTFVNRASVDGHDGLGNDISDHEYKANDNNDNWLFSKRNGQIVFASNGIFKI